MSNFREFYDDFFKGDTATMPAPMSDLGLRHAKGLHPAELMSHSNGITFIYALNRLFFGSNKLYHSNLINQTPVLARLAADDVMQSMPPGVALLGRTGEIESGHKLCAFWDSDGDAKKLFIPCVKKLIADGHLTDMDIVSLPPYGNPKYVKDVLSKFEVKEMTPAEKHKMELMRRLHLMQGAEKKQTLASMGALKGTPASQKYGLTPGQKHWALNSENFSFKNWLESL